MALGSCENPATQVVPQRLRPSRKLVGLGVMLALGAGLAEVAGTARQGGYASRVPEEVSRR